MNRNSHHATLLDLVDKLFDGEIDSAAFERLETALREDEAARQTYIEYLDLHGELLKLAGHEGVHYRESAACGGAPPLATRRLLAVLAASAALLLLIAWAGWRRQGAVDAPLASAPEEPPIVAWIEKGAGACIVADGDATTWREELSRGDALHAGDRLELGANASEVVVVRFKSGVAAFLDGAGASAPAVLSLFSDNSCDFLSGVAMFRVPRTASGFTVETGAGRFVDVGTEFGVVARPGGPAEAHVLKGIVSATSPDGFHAVDLHEGQAALLDTAAPAPQLVPFAAEEFARPAGYAYGLEHISPSIQFHPIRIAGLGPEIVGRPDLVHLGKEGSYLAADADLDFRSLVARVAPTRNEPGTDDTEFHIPAGVRFDSYALQFGPNPRPSMSPIVVGELKFQRRILAVIADRKQLDATSRQFGGYLPRVSQDDRQPEGARVEVVEFDDAANRLTFHLRIGANGLCFYRILVASDDSVP